MLTGATYVPAAQTNRSGFFECKITRQSLTMAPKGITKALCPGVDGYLLRKTRSEKESQVGHNLRPPGAPPDGSFHSCFASFMLW